MDEAKQAPKWAIDKTHPLGDWSITAYGDKLYTVRPSSEQKLALELLIEDANRGVLVDGLLKAIRGIDTASWFKLTAVERSRRWDGLREAVAKAGGHDR